MCYPQGQVKRTPLPCPSGFLWEISPFPSPTYHSFKLVSGNMVEIEDYTKALEVLKEYPSRDGLHIDTLLDSDSHGALTYNDFLILPGSISKGMNRITLVTSSNPTHSFSSVGRFFGYQSN